jgi:streptomycin 6-kinase
MIAVPEVVRNKALAAGAGAWLRDLPQLVAELEHRWEIVVGEALSGGTEAFVAPAECADGSPAVLKLLLPRADPVAEHEITVLRLAGGSGCVRLLRDDEFLGAMLLERLGPSLAEQGLPIAARHEVICATLAQLWRPAPGWGLPTGADKGRWLIDAITTMWTELDEPCSERAVDDALCCAHRRIAAHDDERAVLVHGDAHQWNVLRADDGFRLIDPDGLVVEPEYDLGIVMREDPVELLDGDPRRRAAWLAARTGLDPTAIWEWGVVERISTGLLCTKIGLQPAGRQLLAAADALAG